MSSPPAVDARSAGIPPVVYVGPTLAEQEVREALPGAEIRPPVRRGDLYRDRMLRYSVFVVIDGVFHQHDALPPREVIDVLGDGAWVVGASSMGALRAAECWPVGMQGVGSIYRLFRRGALGSDDEVAVSFDPNERRRASVPLINVRYAVSRAVRHRKLDRALGARLVKIAADSFYADRDWRTLLRGAGANDRDGRLEATLSSYDLKRADALTALRRVSRRLARDPELAYRPRRSRTPFAPAESYRERMHSALDGLEAHAVKPALMRFLLASGRHRRVLPRPVDTEEATSRSHEFADRIWAELAASDDLDAEIFRWRAIRVASERARHAGLEPRQIDRELADREIAEEHGCASWWELEQRLAPEPELWSWIVGYREELAWTKRLRAVLFRPS
jgi:hypothetical protein